MSRQLKVLTAIGPDRPGLVKEISAGIHRAGANIEDSRMAILGGEFAMLLLCSGTSAQLEAAEKEARRAAGSLGLEIGFRDTRLAEPRAGVSKHHLEVSGLDHPGIVEAVAGVLASHAVNVASLESRLVHQPLSGTPIFVLEADLEVPNGVVLAQLERALQDVSERESLELSVRPNG